nr:MAG TPA: hypothetical protein [Caudoviricetes sp.]
MPEYTSHGKTPMRMLLLVSRLDSNWKLMAL